MIIIQVTDDLENKRQTIEKREKEVAILRTELESIKAKNHDLVTTKVSLRCYEGGLNRIGWSVTVCSLSNVG
jgi:hypothetical protein